MEVEFITNQPEAIAFQGDSLNNGVWKTSRYFEKLARELDLTNLRNCRKE